ncbi:MAG: tRNA (adenosine(37)-N6)-threonylcarbamoyltransferase complex dimerization subunit type 1 TsaB [Pseudomonadota bacterium]
MILLGIDTSAHLCAVCVYDATEQKVYAEQTSDIGRGHAELLFDQIEACLKASGLEYSDISRVGVTIGPGSFTGVRVGLAAARGLGLSLNVDVVGVSTLDAGEALAFQTGFDGELATILDARRDEAYCKWPNGVSEIRKLKDINRILLEQNFAICGSAIPILEENFDLKNEVIHREGVVPVELVCKIASTKPVDNSSADPLYLRGADAKSQMGFTLPRA